MAEKVIAFKSSIEVTAALSVNTRGNVTPFSEQRIDFAVGIMVRGAVVHGSIPVINSADFCDGLEQSRPY